VDQTRGELKTGVAIAVLGRLIAAVAQSWYTAALIYGIAVFAAGAAQR
jgi:hypothetical protein